MDLLGFGWRDGVLLLAALTAIYLMLSLLKLTQLRRRQASSDEAMIPEAPTLPPQLADVPQEPFPPGVPVVAAPQVSFGDQLAARVGIDEEMGRLRDEVETLRQEVAELRAARRVSPQYSDAMALAQRGYDAQGIAAECGISVGEAELVSALSRGATHFDDEVDDDEDVRDTAAGFRGR